jgi:hypothetical protein
MGSSTLQTLQDPILLLPWVCFRGGGFPNPVFEGSLLERTRASTNDFLAGSSRLPRLFQHILTCRVSCRQIQP